MPKITGRFLIHLFLFVPKNSSKKLIAKYKKKLRLIRNVLHFNIVTFFHKDSSLLISMILFNQFTENVFEQKIGNIL